MNPLIQLEQTISRFVVALALACFGLSPAVQAVSPAPDGGYPNRNTAEGDSALLSLTIGSGNTAIGWFTLKSDTTGANNNSSQVTGSSWIPSGALPIPGAVADFNGDGHPDFVLRDAMTRQTAIWYLNNNVLIGTAYAPTLPAGWSLVP